LLLCGAFTATWNAVGVSVIQLADVFLLAALSLSGLLVLFGGVRVHIAWWLWAPGVALWLCVLVRTIEPVPDAFFAPRFQLADVGPDNLVRSLLWMLALIGVPFAVIVGSAIDRRVPKWIMAAYFAGVSLSCVVALSDLTGLTHISLSLGYQGISLRQVGLTTHPNMLGVVCVIAAPFGVFFVGTAQRNWIPAVGLFLLGAGSLVSGSRGAQLMFPVAIVATILLVPQRKRIVQRLSATVVVVLVIGGIGLVVTGKTGVITGAFDDILRFGGGQTATDSDSDRFVLARQALNDFGDSPYFGIGVRHIVEAHNIYLQIISAGGICLAVGMLLYWIGALRAGFMLKRRGDVLASSLLVSIVMWLLVGVIENQLTDRLLYYGIACVAALVGTQAAAAHDGWSQLSFAGIRAPDPRT
jgi:hypothetical protein